MSFVPIGLERLRRFMPVTKEAAPPLAVAPPNMKEAASSAEDADGD